MLKQRHLSIPARKEGNLAAEAPLAPGAGQGIALTILENTRRKGITTETIDVNGHVLMSEQDITAMKGSTLGTAIGDE